MKRRTIITSILVIVLCLGLISGSTFALFTSTSSVNIAVTSGKVKVSATLSTPILYSANASVTTTDGKAVKTTDTTSDGADGTLTGTFAGTYYYQSQTGEFLNGGTASYTAPTLTIDKMTPGDKVKTTLSVGNESNVAIQYRLKIEATSTSNLDVLSLLKIDYDGKLYTGLKSFTSTWTLVPAPTSTTDPMATKDISIIFPLDVDGEEYMDKTVGFVFTVEAVQSNANTSGATTIEFATSGGTSTATAQTLTATAEIATVANTTVTTPSTATTEINDANNVATTSIPVSTTFYKDPAGTNDSITATYGTTGALSRTIDVVPTSPTSTTVDISFTYTETNTSTQASTTTAVTGFDKIVTNTANIGANLLSVTVTRSHNGQVTPMTESNDPTVEGFSYDPATGILTIRSKLYSEYGVNFVQAVTRIGTTYYTSIKEAVEAAVYGDTIYLLADVTADSFVIGSAYYKRPCVVDYLKRGITFDGQNHTISFAKQTEKTNLFAQMAGTLKNVTLENMNASIICDGYLGAKFENVTTKGTMNVDGNCGAFVIYVWGERDSSDPNTFTLTNCVADVNMIGTGTSSDYNAAFVGYMVDQYYHLIFNNCINKGNIVCGSAGLFLANIRTYASYGSTVEINNCSNQGKIHRTYDAEGLYRVNQLLYGTVSDWSVTTIIDNVEYNIDQVKSRVAETAISGNPLVLGAPNETLALTKNADGTFSVTPSNNANVEYYVVQIGVYTGRNSGGSNRNYISEKITDTSVKTTIKDLKFVDSTWMTNNNVTTTTDVVVGDKTYKTCTLDNVEYYLINDLTNESLSGAAKPVEMYSVSAYSSSNELLASTGLSVQ